MNARPDILQPYATARIAVAGLPGLEIRPWRGREDLPAVADVCRRSATADRIDQVVSRAEWERLIQPTSHFDPASDLYLVEAAGEVVGYVQTRACREASGTQVYRHVGALVPEWRRRGVGATMLAQAHRRLREVARLAGVGRSAYFQVEAAETQYGLVVLLLRDGYAAVRHRYLMVRRNLDAISQADLPAGVEIRPARPEHYRAIWQAHEEAARDRWGHVTCHPDGLREWLDGPACQPELWQVAWEGDQVVGVAVPSIPAEENAALPRRRGLLNSLAVRRAWRRRGLARALTIRSLACLREAGLREAALVADAEDSFGALRLFGSLGFRAVRRSTIYRRALHGR